MHTLPDLVQTISDALSQANRTWHAIALPEEDQQAHTVQFFENIAQLSQDFIGSQHKFEQILTERIETKSKLLQDLAQQLDITYSITATQKYSELIQIEKFYCLFLEELNGRTEKFKELSSKLSLLLEDADISYTIDNSLKNDNLQLLTLKTLEVEEILRPKREVLAKLQNDLKYYIGMFQRKVNPDSSLNRVIILNLENNGRVSHIPQLNIIIHDYKQELIQRQQTTPLLITQLYGKQKILQFCQTSLLENSSIEATQRQPFLALDDDFTDAFYFALNRELIEIDRILSENEPVIQISLIQKKTQLLTQINPNYVNFETNTPIQLLITQIDQISKLILLFAPVSASVNKFISYKAMKHELLQITKDPTRFTSKSRDASKMRQREEILRKDITMNFPKCMADLKSQIIDLSHRMSEIGVEMTINDVLGVDYMREMEQILQTQDKAFQMRFEKFYQFYVKKDTRNQIAVGKSINFIKTPNVRGTPGRGTPGKVNLGKTTPSRATPARALGMSKGPGLGASSRLGQSASRIGGIK